MNGEVVYFYLYDVGRNIDLKLIPSLIPGTSPQFLKLAKATPANIAIPKPLMGQIASFELSSHPLIRKVEISVKIYEEGVISLIPRISFQNLDITQLHTLHEMEFETLEGEQNIDSWIKSISQTIIARITPAIIKDINYQNVPECETYAAYCLTDPINELENPREFVRNNQKYLANFLLGEKPELSLHESYINTTLNNAFSFLDKDLIIFDWDRCILIDTSKSYEDVLLIIELANYQQLEVRVLDKVLEKMLDQAEDDIKKIYLKKTARNFGLRKKLGRLTRLRYDVIFNLENLENVTKIIGDYFLAQIYTHMCKLFRLEEWSISIRKRLDYLSDIYRIAKEDSNERILLISELLVVILIVFELLTALFE